MVTTIVSGFLLAVAAPRLHRYGRQRSGYALAALLLASAAYFLSQAGSIAAGETVRASFPWVPSLGLAWSFQLDGLSLLFTILVCLAGAAVVLHASGYLAGHPRLGHFYGVMLAFTASMLGLVLADNLLVLFLFWELTSVCSYLLIGFKHERAAARAAALQALLVTGVGGLAMLAGIVLIGSAAGTYEISEIVAAGGVQQSTVYLPALLLVLAGVFTKSAQFPFHFWLPGAMEAPAPVSAYLHAATMVKAGIYLLARLLPALGGTEAWTLTVAGTGAVTMLLGAWVSYRQHHLKLILAYSTVSALGTLTLLLGLGTATAVKAALVFLVGHVLYKGAMFLLAGNAEHGAGTADIRRISGLRRAMPWTAAAALAAGIVMAGLPPSFGFLAKESLLLAALAHPALAVAAVAASALTLASAGLVAIRPFHGRPLGAEQAHEAPFSMVSGPLALAFLGLLLGMGGPLAGKLFTGPAAAAAGQSAIAKLSLWHGWTLELGLSMIAVAAGVLLYYFRVRSLAPAGGDEQETGAVNSAYASVMNGTLALAKGLTRTLQSGYLRRYLLIVFGATFALAAYGFLRVEGWTRLGGPGALGWQETVAGGLVIGSALLVILARKLVTAIVALGVAGYGIGLLFLIHSAPDLAMTQFVVETLVVVLFLLNVPRLPEFRRRSGAAVRARDGAIAAAAGGVITLLTLLAAGVTHETPVSSYFGEMSYLEAFGRNVVNVILVDFRALDTLGEIAVLAIAALGVAGLLGMKRRTNQ